MDFRYYNRILILIAFTLLAVQVHLQAQNDIAYDHLMTASTYFNPSFAGADGNASFSHNFNDNNFSSGAQGSTSVLFSFDKHIQRFNSGIGLIGYYNQMSPQQSSSVYIGGIYSKIIGINDDMRITPSVKVGYIYNRNKMIIPQDSSWADTTERDLKGYDYSAGLLVNDNRFYAGIAVDHLLQPKISYYNNADNILHRKYVAQFGYHYSWNTERSSLWHLNFIMQYQKKNSYLFVNDYLVSRKFRYRMGQMEYYYRILLGLGYKYVIEPDNFHVAYLGFGLQDRNVTLGGGVEFTTNSYVPRTFEVSLKYVIRN